MAAVSEGSSFRHLPLDSDLLVEGANAFDETQLTRMMTRMDCVLGNDRRQVLGCDLEPSETEMVV